MMKNKIAAMQPYVFPYIGYFQLISVADIFVFLDNVNYIKGGWINRNQIVLNQQPHFFTIPCEKISQHKKINQIVPAFTEKEQQRFLKTIEQAYRKAPFFEQIYSELLTWARKSHTSIAEMAADSVLWSCAYLGINRTFEMGSLLQGDGIFKDPTSRMLNLCEVCKSTLYVNMAGGAHLYDPHEFQKNSIQLQFIQPELKPYSKAPNSTYYPGMSILDAMMYLTKQQVLDLIEKTPLDSN
jgi:hypothetical protein